MKELVKSIRLLWQIAKELPRFVLSLYSHKQVRKSILATCGLAVGAVALIAIIANFMPARWYKDTIVIGDTTVTARDISQ
ncbi:MAG: hypothetical protein LBC95_01410, partial [Candidatus Nomurabacteria bacterium]|nr:hypothetical protein [Candidatus Nomurabacteria bacterium]